MALAVSFLTGVTQHTSMNEVAALMDKEPKQTLAHAPWKNYPYHPQVQFSIAHCENAVLLQYTVQEKAVRALHNAPNSPVYEDSCVEFFIAFDKEAAYYNFEFNCIGTCQAGYGEKRHSRQLLPEENIRRIQYLSQFSNGRWVLSLSIPFSCFFQHHLSTLRGKTARGNFYKCGDALPDPHFLSWSNIHWPEPNFHLPTFFDVIDFRTA
jgi:hypothetical protein